jgi:osmotically inducible protein OsmC
MQLSGVLGEAGHTPDSVKTTAVLSLDKDEGGFTITRIDLASEVKLEGIDDAEFQQHAQKAKEICPVSRALGAIEIGLEAKLAS